MKFFIPAAETKEQVQNIFTGIQKFLEEQGHGVVDRKIFRLHYTHDQKEYHAEVGKAHPLNGEPVVAILYEPGKSLYLVCTNNRGVLRGIPILVGKHDVISFEDFEKE